MPHPFKTKKSIALTVLAVIALWLALAVPHWVRVFNAMQIYLYGYPLVTMAVTKDSMTAPEAMRVAPEKRKMGVAALNQFGHVREFPDHTFKDVVAPNADTLYSIAWLDLNRGPQVLHMPDMQGRWVQMEMLDAWTNAYTSLGTRLYGGGKRDYLITGPGWTGKVPEGLTHVQSPTRIGWIIGRTYTRNAADFANVREFQAKYVLEPFKSETTATTPPDATAGKVDIETPPVRQLARMDAKTFYTRMAALMVDNHPAAADAPMLERMERFGIKAGTPLQWDALNEQTQQALQEGLEWSRGLFEGFAPGTQGELHLSALQSSAMEFLARRIRKSALAPVNGWGISLNLGVYGTNYPLRALVTLVGLGANVANDAVYPMTAIDANNAPLDGNNRYVLHFNKDEIPPAAAFWSLTMYDSESFFIDNPIRRYAIGDRNPMQFNADGSLDIWIQTDAPEASRQENWLPAPKAPFKLILRIYDPKAEVLNKQWKPPAPQRLP